MEKMVDDRERPILINMGVERMLTVTQTNSATAQEALRQAKNSRLRRWP
ncbi:hypothetical protein LQZ18_16070 [Lachnospiraceae bacterium ZAX-1]